MTESPRIGHAIKSVSNLVKLSIDRRISEIPVEGLTVMQGWIIGYLYHHRDTQDSFQHDLEKHFNIRRSTASGILQRMERDGLIERLPVPYDARRKKIILLPKAVDIHETVMQAIDEVEAQIASDLSQEDIRTLFALLDKIKHNLQ